jgi:hypothetical protein
MFKRALIPALRRISRRSTWNFYWNPAIFSDDINPKMPVVFYNNDRTKQFKIVVEGLTADGKMLMIEKTIGGRKGF